jgi:hypothetical protein
MEKPSARFSFAMNAIIIDIIKLNHAINFMNSEIVSKAELCP